MNGPTRPLGAIGSGERTANGKVRRFATCTRTAEGERDDANGTSRDARAELGTIVERKGPVVLGDDQAAWVYHTTRTASIAAWARSAEIQAAIPNVAAIVSDKTPKVRQVGIDLSSIGWDIAEYPKLIRLE